MERVFEERCVVVDSTVTNASGEERTLSCTLRLVNTKKFGWVVHISQGGITGWEYFGVENRKIVAKDFEKGWEACSGGGGYDKLYISGAEMIKALRELNIIE